MEYYVKGGLQKCYCSYHYYASGKRPLQLWATFATLQSCKVAKVAKVWQLWKVRYMNFQSCCTTFQSWKTTFSSTLVFVFNFGTTTYLLNFRTLVGHRTKFNSIRIRYKWIIRDAILYKIWTGARGWRNVEKRPTLVFFFFRTVPLDSPPPHLPNIVCFSHTYVFFFLNLEDLQCVTSNKLCTGRLPPFDQGCA